MRRFCLRGFGNDFGYRFRRNPGRATGARRVSEQTLNAEQTKTAAPQGGHPCAHPKFGGDLLILKPIGGKQNDAAAHNNPRRQRTLAAEPLQFSARSWIEYDCRGNSHGKVSSS
jgi:hypothetical protein